MAGTYLHQFIIFLFLLLHVICLQSANVFEFNINPGSNGQVELVCKITNIDENQWVAIYRYFGHYAECMFWEKASVSNGPFSCTGDFEVTISRPAVRQITYTVLYNLPISSPNEGNYFCRVLSETDNGEYSLDASALELDQMNLDRDVGSYINDYPTCSPRTTTYNAGESVELTCTALGNVPATVQWKRNGKTLEGYPKTFNHGVDPGTSPVGNPEFYNKDGYIMVTTRMTVTLTESDELSYYTCEMSSPNITSSCNIGPFTLDGCEETVTESRGNCTYNEPKTVLGLDMWLFTTIIACVIVAMLTVSNVVLACCFYKARKKATYLIRKSSHMPIMAHQEETELETVPYDSAQNPYVEDNKEHMEQMQNSGGQTNLHSYIGHTNPHSYVPNGGQANLGYIPNGGQANHHVPNGHMINRGRPDIDITPQNPQTDPDESHYSDYPENEFIYDWGPEDEAVYSNQEEVSQQVNRGRESIYRNNIDPIKHHSQSIYENH